MAEKKQVEIKTLKEGSYVLLENEPCTVKSIQKSKPGKHGGAKARVVATGVFTGQKRNMVKPGSSKVDVPIIEKKAAQVLAKTGNTLQLMDLETYENFDVSVDDEIAGKVQEGGEVVYWKYDTFIMVKGPKTV